MIYVVTDIETDGPAHGANSMIAFASVAIHDDGAVLDEFEAVLKPRGDRAPDPDTMAWWRTQPDAWAAATQNAEPAADVMPRYADWVDGLCDRSERRVFAAKPLAFDGPYMDEYLRTFAGTRYFDGPFAGRQIFQGPGLDIVSFAMGLFGAVEVPSVYAAIPDEWLGSHPHTHRAIDDARGYAHLLGRLLAIAREAPKRDDDFLR